MRIGMEKMSVIATYMNDEIRERLHSELAPCEPEEFLKRYVEEEPEFSEFLKLEFDLEVER